MKFANESGTYQPHELPDLCDLFWIAVRVIWMFEDLDSFRNEELLLLVPFLLGHAELAGALDKVIGVLGKYQRKSPTTKPPNVKDPRSRAST